MAGIWNNSTKESSRAVLNRVMAKASTKETKARVIENLSDAVAKYLKSGGKVQQIERGQHAIDVTTNMPFKHTSQGAVKHSSQGAVKCL